MSDGAPRELSPARHEAVPDAGSFRDRSNRVYRAGGAIYRGVSETAFANFKALSQAAFYKALADEGKLVGTSALGAGEQARLGALGRWPAALTHETAPFISYPYEWSFSMLKDAALLHLEILRRAIPEGWILKDSSAYNIQFFGARPVFIDIPSFEPYRAGAPWSAYRQFCMMFLYPLMLKAYLGVDFGPLMRASLDGIEPALANRLLGRAARFRRGVLAHVVFHARLEARAAARELDEARRLTEDAGGAPATRKGAHHSLAMVLGLIEGMESLVRSLKSPDERTVWGEYDADHSYSDASHQRKKEFVARAAEAGDYQTVWDIGCNTGLFSRLCAQRGAMVISIDGDQKAIDRLYLKEKAEGGGNILPLIVNLANASPNQGWRGEERKSLDRRGKPDLVLCLALIHHVVISANIPMRDFIDWLASLGGDAVIEFVSADDAMVRMLLRGRVNQYDDYTVSEFERCVRAHYEIDAREDLKGGHRTIYYLRRR